MRLAFGFVLSVSLAALVSPAHASAPVPIGYWTTDGDGETLIIQQSGQCSLQASNGYAIGGACSWNASSNGGILTIINGINQYQPAPIYFNIIWVDQQTITVEGDVFHRRQ